MQPIGFQDVDITGGFWQQVQQRNRKTTVYAVRDRFADTGRFEAFNFSWKEGMPNKPHIFWDSDIAKWAESVAYILQKGGDAGDRPHRRPPGGERLLQHLLYGVRARGPLHPAHRPRALLRRAPDRGGGGLLPGHGQGSLPAADVPLRRRYRPGLSPGGLRALRHPRPRGDRAGPGQALPLYRAAALPGAGQVLHRPARRQRQGPGKRVPLRPAQLLPEPPARARAAHRRGPQRARLLPLLRHGGSGGHLPG